MLKLDKIALEIDNRKLVSHPVSLSLENGTCTAFIGRNGTGKTTLLKTIAGQLKNKSGEISIDNATISSSNPLEWSRHCSFIPSSSEIKIYLTVYDYFLSARLGFANRLGLLSKTDYKKTDEIIQRFNLEKFAHKYFNQLSDGEKQMISIARSLLYEANVILLDEPTSFLDVPNKLKVAKLLRQIAIENQKIIVYTTHDFMSTEEHINAIWFIDKSQTLHTGEYSQLKPIIASDFELIPQ